MDLHALSEAHSLALRQASTCAGISDARERWRSWDEACTRAMGAA